MTQKLSLAGMVLAAGMALHSGCGRKDFNGLFSERIQKKSDQSSSECSDLIKKVIRDSQRYVVLFNYMESPQLTHQLLSESNGRGIYCSRNEGKSYDRVVFTWNLDDLTEENLRQGWRLAAIINKGSSCGRDSLYILTSRNSWQVYDETYMNFDLLNSPHHDY